MLSEWVTGTDAAGFWPVWRERRAALQSSAESCCCAGADDPLLSFYWFPFLPQLVEPRSLPGHSGTRRTHPHCRSMSPRIFLETPPSLRGTQRTERSESRRTPCAPSLCFHPASCELHLWPSSSRCSSSASKHKNKIIFSHEIPQIAALQIISESSDIITSHSFTEQWHNYNRKSKKEWCHRSEKSPSPEGDFCCFLQNASRSEQDDPTDKCSPQCQLLLWSWIFPHI